MYFAASPGSCIGLMVFRLKHHVILNFFGFLGNQMLNPILDLQSMATIYSFKKHGFQPLWFKFKDRENELKNIRFCFKLPVLCGSKKHTKKTMCVPFCIATFGIKQINLTKFQFDSDKILRFYLIFWCSFNFIEALTAKMRICFF